MLLAIAGQKGHGKDTLANLIRDAATTTPVKITAFAKPLKALCMEVFGLTAYDVNDSAGKEAHYGPVRLDDYIELLRQRTGLPIEPRGLTATTPREIPQQVGTEYVRAVAPEYWIDQCIAACDAHTIISDCRYPNEFAAVRAAGGMAARIIRRGACQSATHSSEELTEVADWTYSVGEGNFEAMRRIARKLLEWVKQPEGECKLCGGENGFHAWNCARVRHLTA